MSAAADLSAAALRRAFGEFGTGVAVAFAQTAARRAAVTINSLASVSLDPPLLSFSLARAAACLETFLACRTPTISILGESDRWIAANFARPSRCRWQGIPLRESADGRLAVAGALATFECRRESELVAGDHVLFLLAVIRAQVAEAAPPPLLFFRSAFGTFRPGHSAPTMADSVMGWG